MEKDHLAIILEEMNRKFALVLEGNDVLNRKIDDLALNTDERFKLLEFRLDTVKDSLGRKIDAVAADLTAHRADTEVHQGCI